MQKLQEIIRLIKFWFIMVWVIFSIIFILVLHVNVAFFGGSMPRFDICRAGKYNYACNVEW